MAYNDMDKDHGAMDYGNRGGGLLAGSNDDDRKGFVIKVYSILTVQLALTFGSVGLVTASDSMRANL